MALWGSGIARADPLLDRLDSPDYATREAASAELLTGPLLDESRWLALFAQARSPEQRHRLLAAAEHQALTAMRLREFPQRGPGSLGMTHQVISPAQREHLGRAAILVLGTLPGFPAHAHLRPGDLIVAFNEQTIEPEMTPNAFPQMVQLTQAGQTVTLTVLRDGREQTLRMELAGFEPLARMYDGNDTGSPPGLTARFALPWQQLRQHYLAAAAATAPAPIPVMTRP